MPNDNNNPRYIGLTNLNFSELKEIDEGNVYNDTG